MAIVVVYPLLASASEISAEPCLTPVAHFLATGSYGYKCETTLSKLFRKPFGPLSISTLQMLITIWTLQIWQQIWKQQ